MERALYCPLYGYYEKKRDNPGRRGDFLTSVSVGSVFGELLAFQFVQWLELSARKNSRVQIVEAGAHDGQLAKDILTWLRAQRARLLERVDYWIIEPSATRKSWQEETLQEFKAHVRWAGKVSETPPVRGVIFSNELLDAFPVHRIGWDAKSRTWFEWGVALQGGEWVWAKISPSGSWRAPELPEELLRLLPDQFTTELSPDAETWWREAAGALVQGKLLAIDYGLEADEFFRPERAAGTLRGYHRHQRSDNVLARPGEQDLTSHVNFSALQQAGEAAGLETELFVGQAKFLTDIAAAIQRNGGFAEWDSSRTRQFQTLTHPEHLGRPFKVLVQSR